MATPSSRFEELVKTLEAFSAQAPIEPLAFGDATDKLDKSAYSFTAILAVLPFLQPIPLGLFALIGSAAFIALGLQLYRGEQVLSLPEKIRKVTLSQRTRKTLTNTCLNIVKFFRRFTKPRLSHLAQGKQGQEIGGFIFVVVGALVAIPLGGVVPFKNLFPSLAVLFYCTGEIENDGVMVIMALFCLVLTCLFYGLLIYIVWKFGSAAISHFVWK